MLMNVGTLLLLAAHVQCSTPSPPFDCTPPLTVVTKDPFTCLFSVYNVGLDAMPDEGCQCPLRTKERLNYDGTIDCVNDYDECHDLTGHGTCADPSLFCLNGKQCICTPGDYGPLCTSVGCIDEKYEGCWVYRPYGCQYISPCPKDEAIFDQDDADDFCSNRPTALFCLADDCKTCWCFGRKFAGQCTNSTCPELSVDSGKGCVTEKEGNCGFASKVVDFLDDSLRKEPKAFECKPPLTSGENAGTIGSECIYTAYKIYATDYVIEGCYCPLGKEERLNYDGSIDCVDTRAECYDLAGHEPCTSSSQFCLNGKQCVCRKGDDGPICSNMECIDEKYEGCWVYRPYGCQYIAPCPKDEVIFNKEGADDFCSNRPTAYFCFADDCKTCRCGYRAFFGTCYNATCPELAVDSGKGCVTEKRGNCAYASNVVNFLDDSLIRKE